MKQYIQHIELINQYINGLLSKSDIKAFENKLEIDVTFKSTYQEHFIFLEGLKRNKIKTEIQTAQNSYVHAKWIKTIAISCGVIVVSVLLYSLLFNADTSEAIQPINDNSKIEIVSDSLVDEKRTETEIQVEDEVKETTEVAIVEAKENTPKKVASQTKNESTDIFEIANEFTKNIQPEALSDELIEFYKSIRKTPETFEINNEKAVTITCKEGTKMIIPAKAFIDFKTGKLARGLITLEVTEYYKLSDMLLANLTTKSDNALLETAGMLYIEANKKGSRLKLKPENKIQIIFNNKGKKDMQLFSGEHINNNINWNLEDNSTETVVSNLMFEKEGIEDNIEVPIKMVEEPPVFPGCENGTKIEKRKCFEDNMQSIIEKNFNESIAEDLNLIGNHRISVSFKINREGEITNAQAYASHIALAREAIRVVELIPKMVPAKQRGKTVFVSYSLPIYFKVGESTKNNPVLITVKGKNKLKSKFESSIEARLIARDSSGTNGNVGKPITANEISRYAFSILQLGWINCDRFVRIKNKLKFKIKIKHADGANVKMVFKSLSSILPSNKQQDEFDFGIIPANEKVTLVAIKEKDGKFYLALKNTKTKLNPNIDFDFKVVTVEELKKELEKLNNTFN